MNCIIKSSLFAVICACTTASAQTPDKKPKIEKQESIIIRKDGNSKEKLTIIVDGDKVTVNGKPVEDYKGDDVEIIRDDMHRPFIAPMPPMAAFAPRGGTKMFKDHFMQMGNKAFLGVVTEKANDGARITQVTKESAAEKAGLKEGDVITKVGDKNVSDADDVFDAINKYNPGDKVTISYKRDGKESNASAILTKNDMPVMWNDNGDFNFEFNDDGNGPYFFGRKPHLGLRVQDTEESNGVKITDVEDEDAPAGKAGIKEGDIITEINGKAVSSVDELKDAIKNMKEGDTIKMQYKRDNKLQSADVKIPKHLKTSNL